MASKTTKKKTTTKKATAKKATANKTKKATAKKTTKRASRAKTDGPALVIVESAAKARTIERYLGAGFAVRASVGHVRDLPKKGLGIDIDEKGFHPRYEVIPEKEKIVKDLATLARKAPMVYLATDLDREGEAIAWHLAEALDVPAERQTRVTFTEITKRAIEAAFEKPGHIDTDRVAAQQARRILDRIVGYPLSRLLSKSVSRGLSAGRVQSVALRLVVEREQAIRAFEPMDYWRVFADLRRPGDADDAAFTADLIGVDGLDVTGPEDAEQDADESDRAAARRKRRATSRELRLPSEELANQVLAEIRAETFRVESVEAKRRADAPSPPLITSTLQQQAATRLRWSAKRTMSVAQGLYQGAQIAGEGSTGLITYMRTDSVSLAAEAVSACRDFVSTRFGKEYVPDKPNHFSSRKGAQEAHEAIRPTDVTRTPDSLRGKIDDEALKLYEVIWRRFVACQMAPAQIDTTVVRMRAGRALFETRGRVVAFAGWRAADVRAATRSADALLPAVAEGDPLDLLEVRSDMRTTQPPPRYTEASLVRKLEREGIGRPSTYATIISKIQDRKYVTKESGSFHASELGEVVTNRMVPFFPDVMNVAFTRQMEESLDAVEQGREDWQTVLLRFHKSFLADYERADEEMPKQKHEPALDQPPCEECGKPMLLRFSKGRKFYGCSGYPECKATRSGDGDDRPAAEPTDHVCELCEKPMVIRSGRRGKFVACTGYPECKNTKNIREDGTIVETKPTGEKCEKCGADMVEKTGRRGPFLACSAFPKCRNARDIGSKPGAPGAEPAVPDVELPPCPKCGGPMSLRRGGRGSFCGCMKYPECKGTAPAPKGAQPARAPTRPAGVNCTECGQPMLIRRGRRGEFAGCSGYPKCRTTMPLTELPQA